MEEFVSGIWHFVASGECGVRVAASARHQLVIGARIEKRCASPRSLMPRVKAVAYRFIAVMMLACARRLYDMTRNLISCVVDLTVPTFFPPDTPGLWPSLGRWASFVK